MLGRFLGSSHDGPDTRPSAVDASALLRRARRLRFRVKPDTAAALAGAYHSARPGAGLTFSELRAYEPGDDVRYFDWNVTARQGRPYVRRFVEERALSLWLVIDVSASMRFGKESQTKADRAAQCATLLAAAAIQNGDRVGLMLVSDAIELELRPGGGFRHFSRLLRALIATPTTSPRTSLRTILPTLRRAPRRALVFLVSDFLEREPVPQWRAIVARHDVVALRVVDPLEQSLPNVGLIRAEDAESRKRVLIDSSRETVRALYAEQAAQKAAAFQRWCAECGVSGLTVSTRDDPITPLLGFFRERSRLSHVGMRR